MRGREDAVGGGRDGGGGDRDGVGGDREDAVGGGNDGVGGDKEEWAEAEKTWWVETGGGNNGVGGDTNGGAETERERRRQTQRGGGRDGGGWKEASLVWTPIFVQTLLSVPRSVSNCPFLYYHSQTSRIFCDVDRWHHYPYYG